MIKDKGMTLFFSAKDPFSNWYKRDFKVKGIQFNCGEQYMMYSKAKLFNDEETASKILATSDPKIQKALGREVKGYIEDVWEERRMRIMVAGLKQKFSQHKDLSELLMSTSGTELVEASKWDKIWGVGLAESDPNIYDKSKWRGQNLLGKVLADVRKYLLDMNKSIEPGQ
jgi:ribA/ribD-fused uncharacterized protein